MTFINLHNHDEYSLLDGFGTAKDYAERAKHLGQTALASTNHGNVDGLIKHQKACQEVGIKPILGCELYVVPEPVVKQKGEQRGHMVVLVRNWAGWKALCTLLSRANLEGFYGRPRVGFQWIKELDEEALNGLVFMSGCLQSFLKIEGGKALFEVLKFKGAKTYLEVLPWPSKEQVEWNKKILELSARWDMPFVVTNDTHYVLPEDAQAQEVLLAIQRKSKWSDPGRFRFQYEGLHLRSEREMARAFHKHGSLKEIEYREAMDRTAEIVELCDFIIPKMEISLPNPYGGVGGSADNILTEVVSEGLSQFEEWPAEYQARMEEEFKTITEKKFSTYFLIVYEVVSWCYEQGIMVGPGRGSVGGSLIAYLLGITKIDSVQYGLLFSRFINPERNDYPDIDLDFDTTRREEVRRHLEELYGLNNIAGISTFARMMAKGVVRDVGSVFELPAKDIDTFAKSLTSDKSGGVIAQVRDCEFKRKYPQVTSMAARLEGQVKSAGQHPAALVISNEDLTTSGRCVVMIRKGERIINWDMEDSEYVGLMKLDALYLDNLSVINHALNQIEYAPVLEDLEMDDPEIFSELSKGNTVGVFQLTGYACKRLCIEIGISSFDDIAAVMSLARPGPMDSGMAEDYSKRKKGRPWAKMGVPEYDAIVENTYGVLVYQEQVMKVFTDVAGLSPGTADKIRKVIGKKRDAKEFEPYRQQFMAGCEEQKTLDSRRASEFWEGLLKWASYGFNKSHAVGYSILAYWTAWLKQYQPAEYLSAFLTYGEQNQKEELIAEILPKINLKLSTPKIGISDPFIWTVKEGVLYAPFKEIAGIDKDAHKCNSQRPPGKTGGLKGFFPGIKVEETKPQGTSLQILLDEVKAFDPDPEVRPKDMKKYFGFEFPDTKREYEFRQEYLQEPYEPAEKLDRKSDEWIPFVQERRYRPQRLADCIGCSLRGEAGRVVLPSMGKYNVMILGEAPGVEENDIGQGFVGRAGKLLWNILGEHNLIRRMFCVTNVCKCFPRQTGTPTDEQVKTCAQHWLRDEITGLQTQLILALGGTPLRALKGQPGGIMKLNGTTERFNVPWLPFKTVEVCWCVHPAYALRAGEKGTEMFREGIQNFASIFNDRLNDIPF